MTSVKMSTSEEMSPRMLCICNFEMWLLNSDEGWNIKYLPLYISSEGKLTKERLRNNTEKF